MNRLLVLLACIFTSMPGLLRAADTEPNNIPEQASPMLVNASGTGAISVAGDVDWYKLSTNADGKLSFTLSTSSGKYVSLFLYDANGTSVLKSANSNTSLNLVYDGVGAGNYYLKIAAYYPADIASYTITDSLLVADLNNDAEPNNSMVQPVSLNTNATMYGHIGYSNNSFKDTADWYRIVTPGDGRLRVKINAANTQALQVFLYDSDGFTLLAKDAVNTNVLDKDGLASGIYYVKIKPGSTAGFAPYTITDSLYQPAESNDAEPNNTATSAVAMILNAAKKGHVGFYNNLKRDSADWYKITTTNNGQLRLKIASGNSQYIIVNLYDTNATTLLKTGNSNLPFDVTKDGLAPGTYFVKITGYYPNSFAPYTIVDSFYNAMVTGDAEPNNTALQALPLPVNSTASGQVGYLYNNQRDSADWYKITTTADGLLRLKLTPGNGQQMTVHLFDNNGTTQINYASGLTQFYLNADGLAAGMYYVRVRATAADGFGPYTITDSLLLPDEANDAELNNSAATATALLVNKTVTGHAGYYYNLKRDSADWYKITTPQDGLLKIKLKPGNTQYMYAYLYDADGTTLLKSLNGNTEFSFTADGLAAGNYLLKIMPYYTYGFTPYTLTDSLFTLNEANDAEPNNTALLAAALSVNNTVQGHVGYYNNLKRDTADWYKITTNADGLLQLKISSSNTQSLRMELFDNNTTTLIKSQTGSGTIYLKGDGLAPGTYYVKISSYVNSGFQGYQFTDSLITYTFNNDTEPNNRASAAQNISSLSTVNGHVGFYYNAVRDSSDWFKVTYGGINNMLKFSFNIESRKSDGVRPYVWFYVYRDTTQPPLFLKYFNTASNAVSVNVSAYTTYYIKVIPYYTYDFAAYSIIDSNVQASLVKISVVNAVPANNCTSTNSLQYACSNGIAPYTLQLYRNNIAYGNPVSFSSGFTFNNLPVGTYFARAYSSGATGAAYTQSATSVLAPVPVNLSSRYVNSTSMTLKWTGYSCVKYYLVQVRDKVVGSWSTRTTSGNKDSLTVTGLIANNAYLFRVAAVDSANNVITTSQYSAEQEFITTPPVQSQFAGSVNPGNSNGQGYRDAIVYPNPANAVVNIEAPGAIALSIQDMQGKLVWRTTGLTAKSGKTLVHVNDYIPGVYLLQITYGDMSTVTKKIVIAR